MESERNRRLEDKQSLDKSYFSPLCVKEKTCLGWLETTGTPSGRLCSRDKITSEETVTDTAAQHWDHWFVMGMGDVAELN